MSNFDIGMEEMRQKIRRLEKLYELLPSSCLEKINRIGSIEMDVWLKITSYKDLLDFLKKAGGGFVFDKLYVFSETRGCATYKAFDIEFTFVYDATSPEDLLSFMNNFGFSANCKIVKRSTICSDYFLQCTV
jgi:hypothetical protein